MDQPCLAVLPVEILQTVVRTLDSSSALALTLTCRHIYTSCNDWTLWRDLFTSQRPFELASPFLLSRPAQRRAWKSYVLADALACRLLPLQERDVSNWLPHMIVLNHPFIKFADTAALHQLCANICNSPLPPWSQSTTESSSAMTATRDVAPSTDELHNWRLAQAAGFCLAAQFLAQRTIFSQEKPARLLDTVQWFWMADYLGHDSEIGERHGRNVVLHALANRVVGFFYRELCWALANGATASGTTDGLSQPPTASTIPFYRFCIPLTPFSCRRADSFGMCHLSAMTDPDFFVEDEWTGYSSVSVGSQIRFNGIGGKNTDVIHNRLDQFPNHQLPFRVEPTIRFSLVREWNKGRFYLLQSNYFYSESLLHALRITVDRASGHLKIANNHVVNSSWSVRDAVITPFGIVEAVYPPSYWTWLWKCKWGEKRT